MMDQGVTVWAVTIMIVTGIAAAILKDEIVKFVSWSWRNMMVVVHRKLVGGNYTKEGEIQRKKFERRLLRDIKREQILRPSHYGQFGASTSKLEEARFQKGNENLASKPNMFLTYWPCQILGKHKLAKKELSRASVGLERLFVDNTILAELTGSMPDRASFVVSIRHTMAAALIEQSLSNWTGRVKSIALKSVNSPAQWQNTDGGWKKWSEQQVGSDLWSTLYACQLLASAKLADTQFTDQERVQFSRCLTRALDWLVEEWHKNGYEYGNVTSNESVPFVCCIIGDALRSEDHPLLKLLTEKMLSWLGPENLMSVTYSESLPEVGMAAKQIRLAFALYQSGLEKAKWIALLTNTAKHYSESLTSAELSWALELSKASAE